MRLLCGLGPVEDALEYGLFFGVFDNDGYAVIRASCACTRLDLEVMSRDKMCIFQTEIGSGDSLLEEWRQPCRVLIRDVIHMIHQMNWRDTSIVRTDNELIVSGTRVPYELSDLPPLFIPDFNRRYWHGYHIVGWNYYRENIVSHWPSLILQWLDRISFTNHVLVGKTYEPTWENGVVMERVSATSIALVMEFVMVPIVDPHKQYPWNTVEMLYQNRADCFYCERNFPTSKMYMLMDEPPLPFYEIGKSVGYRPLHQTVRGRRWPWAILRHPDGRAQIEQINDIMHESCGKCMECMEDSKKSVV